MNELVTYVTLFVSVEPYSGRRAQPLCRLDVQWTEGPHRPKLDWTTNAKGRYLKGHNWLKLPLLIYTWSQSDSWVDAATAGNKNEPLHLSHMQQLWTTWKAWDRAVMVSQRLRGNKSWNKKKKDGKICGRNFTLGDQAKTLLRKSVAAKIVLFWLADQAHPCPSCLKLIYWKM